MNRKLLAAIALLAGLVFAGCGGGGTKTTTTTTTAAPPFKAAAALITLADLPSGWEVTPSSDNKGDVFCGKMFSAKALFGIEPVDEASVDFAVGGSEPHGAFHTVSAFPTGQASAAFAAYRKLLSGCTSMTLGGERIKVAPVSFPSLGDESVPVLLTWPGGAPIAFYMVTIRVADGIALVGYGYWASDITQAEKFARLATDKLQQAQAAP